MKYFLLAFSVIAIVYGLVGFYGVWRAPKVLATRAYSAQMLTGPLPRNRSGYMLMLSWILLLGLYIGSVAVDIGLWSLIPWSGFMVVAILMLRRRAQARNAA
jgi:hypothetical protein